MMKKHFLLGILFIGFFVTTQAVIGLSRSRRASLQFGPKLDANINPLFHDKNNLVTNLTDILCKQLLNGQVRMRYCDYTRKA